MILNSAADGIITIDSSGMIEFINDIGCQIFGYKQSDLIGQDFRIVLPEDDDQTDESYILKFFNRAEKMIVGVGKEIVGKRKDEKIFPMDLSISKVSFFDREIFIAIIRDITEAKDAELVLKEQKNELEKSNSLMVGRELKMIELKSQIKALKEKIN